jgi:hypothetical protein
VAGVFPTAASPTAASLPAPPPSAGTGDFPSITLSNQYVKLRFFEPEVTQALNQRWLGMPRGVYLGYEPAVTPGSNILSLNVDATQNFSLLRVPSSEERVMVDIFTDQVVELDFSAHSVWPVYVLASATYKTGSATQGKIFTRAATAVSVNEVLICKVDKPVDDLVIEADIPTTRQPPLAFESQPYGYMPDGSVDNLVTSNAVVAEVVASRTSTHTGSHPDLDSRIDADIVGSSIADRIGLRLVNVVSNVHPNRTGSSVNVSGSFSETGRTLGPNITIEPNGDTSTEGAVTDGTSNFCFVIDAATGHRLIDDATREPVYGLTSFATSSIGGGKEIQFVNASVDVNGNGTNPFVAPLEEGDLVEGPDGLFYEILTITDPDTAVLGAAYQGADASVFNSTFRRWLLFLFTVSGGPYSILAPTSVQFIFPCYFRADKAIFDGLLFIKRTGERPQLQESTSLEEGKALLADDGGLVGSFRTVKSVAATVGNDVHTLNFVHGGASNAGGGVANVSVQGEQGPQGPGANQGPDGPTGAAGFGYSINNSFENGPESTFTLGFGLVSVSHTVDWTAPSSTPTFAAQLPRSYAHVNGGWSIIDGFTPAGWERIHIDGLTDIDDKRTQIDYSIEPAGNQSTTTIACFMGASQ